MPVTKVLIPREPDATFENGDMARAEGWIPFGESLKSQNAPSQIHGRQLLVQGNFPYALVGANGFRYVRPQIWDEWKATRALRPKGGGGKGKGVKVSAGVTFAKRIINKAAQMTPTEDVTAEDIASLNKIGHLLYKDAYAKWEKAMAEKAEKAEGAQ